MNRKQKRTFCRIMLAALLFAALLLIPVKVQIKRFLYLIPYLVIGYDILINAFRGIINAQPFDENFLLAVATVGAIALGEYTEAVAVMLLYQVGELFQSCAVGKSRRSIAQLMDIKSDTANVERDDGSVEVLPAESVSEGCVILVKVGERVPIDGVVVSGVSTLDTSALTGESAPRDALPGCEVLSGCINLTGLLKIKTTRRFEDSTVARILALVQTAGMRKARSEKFISRFARVYTPVVCISALLLAVLPPLVNMLLLNRVAMWSEWIYRALTFLVISCPCALVISVPLTFFSGIGGASRHGILLKGSNCIEALAKVDTVVFDKTGTLTEGKFSVSDIITCGVQPEEVLEYASAAESYSLHPISECIRNSYKVDTAKVSNCEELAGKGVICRYNNKSVAAGNAQLMQRLGICVDESNRPGTVIYTAVDGKYIGAIVVADTLKNGALEAIKAIKSAGVKKTVILSGDREIVARSVAEELGVDKVYAQLLPEQKVDNLEQEMQASHGFTAYVGDGINDAPVIMRADVGIAMGALGSEAAIEAADVVLMDDDPKKVSRAIHISRKCMAIVWQNIIFAVGIKFACLILGALGVANMWIAIFADVGVMILAVLNAIRAMVIK